MVVLICYRPYSDFIHLCGCRYQMVDTEPDNIVVIRNGNHFRPVHYRRRINKLYHRGYLDTPESCVRLHGWTSGALQADADCVRQLF